MSGFLDDGPFGRQQIESMAIALCYAGFSRHENSRTPLGYWRLVTEENKSYYRKRAVMMLKIYRELPAS